MDKQLVKREFFAGLTTFLTMSYIVIVNPTILSTPGTGMSFSGVLTATVLISAISTLAMGLYAKLPYAVAPGMGINAFFTYSLILGQQIPWPEALGMVFWSGIIFLILSVTPVRAAIVHSMPQSIRHGAAIGIGIFLTFIGLKNAGIVIDHPATLVTFGKIGIETLFVCVGLLVCCYLLHKKSPLAFLVSIFSITILSLIFGKTKMPDQWFSMPDFDSVFFKADLIGSLKWAYLPPILSLMFTDMFDSISTFVGLSQASGMVDENGEPKKVKEALLVDSFATGLSGLFGTSSGTAYIESAAGIEAGGRTGLTSVFTALLFIPCFFIGPAVGMVPAIATAPVLIIVGFLMFSVIQKLEFNKIWEGLPAYITLIMIPLTFSITQGLLWGIVSYVLINIFVGRSKQISTSLYVLSAVCFLLFFLNH